MPGVFLCRHLSCHHYCGLTDKKAKFRNVRINKEQVDFIFSRKLYFWISLWFIGHNSKDGLLKKWRIDFSDNLIPFIPPKQCNFSRNEKCFVFTVKIEFRNKIYDGKMKKHFWSRIFIVFYMYFSFLKPFGNLFLWEKLLIAISLGIVRRILNI